MKTEPLRAVSPPLVGKQKAQATPRQRWLISRPDYRWYVPYLFLLPGLTIYLVWVLYPLLYQFYVSLHDWSIMPNKESTFVGLQNYSDVLTNPVFWSSLRNTVQYSVATVIGQIVLGLILAIMVHRVPIGKRFFRAIFYVPVVTSWLVVSFLFLFLFASEEGGLINYVLMSLGVIKDPVTWMSAPATSWIAIYLLGIWKGMGWSMVIFLAALQGIPTDLYEAASVDGADGWQQFVGITLPMLRPAMLFVTVALTIGGFNVFLSVYLMTNGGPLNRTEVMLGHMFKEAFRDLHFGYGAAAAYILALIIVTVSFFQYRFINKPVEN
jgi:multiple sugar transport system permease protein